MIIRFTAAAIGELEEIEAYVARDDPPPRCVSSTRSFTRASRWRARLILAR